MERNAGFTLAMDSRPLFDMNKISGRISRAELKAISEDPLKPMLNRVMNENYHPGSTFKTIISFAGLESSAITPGSTVFCGGGYTMGNHRWRCDKPEGHGSLDLKHALSRSCDVYYSTVGDRVGLDAIAELARRFGYGQPTRPDLGPAIPRIIPDSTTITPQSGSAPAHAIHAGLGPGGIHGP